MAYYNTYITYYDWEVVDIEDDIISTSITLQLTEVNGLYMSLLST